MERDSKKLKKLKECLKCGKKENYYESGYCKECYNEFSKSKAGRIKSRTES